jgi:hypothetical protein
LIPGIGKSGKLRSVWRRLIFAPASSAEREEEEEGCRPEASWLAAAVDVVMFVAEDGVVEETGSWALIVERGRREEEGRGGGEKKK